jgi:membrane protein YdbS with pleckstrin-like domain
MSQTYAHPAPESDAHATLLDDPLLFGLDRPAPGPVPEDADIAEASRLAAARAMLRQIDSQPTGQPPAAENDATDPWDLPAPEPAPSVTLEERSDAVVAVSGESPATSPATPAAAMPAPDLDPTSTIPDGAILAANGQPFRDLDAARFKAARLTEETGEAFDVRPLAPGGFVLVPPLPRVTRPTPQAAGSDRASGALPGKPARKPAATPSVAQADQLTLDNFPEGHPARKYGLPLYKKILSETRKPLRQAWRSQLPLLVVAVLGVLLFLAPDAFVRIAVPPASAERLASPSFVKGVGYMGLALALFMLGKAVYVRINWRYLLTSNYVKSEAGIVARRSAKLVYGTILAIDTHQTVFGRLLNYGTVELSCAGSDGNEILIENVYAPEVVQSVIESRMIEMRGGTYYR